MLLFQIMVFVRVLYIENKNREIISLLKQPAVKHRFA